jgi:hypothetical protein
MICVWLGQEYDSNFIKLYLSSNKFHIVIHSSFVSLNYIVIVINTFVEAFQHM